MDRDDSDWIPRPRRQAARLSARAIMPDGTRRTVVLTDISYLGCKLSSNWPFAKGQSVLVSVPGRGDMIAQIRWVRAGWAGARFVTGDSAKDNRRARIGV